MFVHEQRDTTMEQSTLPRSTTDTIWEGDHPNNFWTKFGYILSNCSSDVQFDPVYLEKKINM